MAPEAVKLPFLVACMAIATLLSLASGHFTIGRELQKWTGQTRPWQKPLVTPEKLNEKQLATERQTEIITEGENLCNKGHSDLLISCNEGTTASFRDVDKPVSKGEQQILKKGRSLRWIRNRVAPPPPLYGGEAANIPSKN